MQVLNGSFSLVQEEKKVLKIFKISKLKSNIFCRKKSQKKNLTKVGDEIDTCRGPGPVFSIIFEVPFSMLFDLLLSQTLPLKHFKNLPFLPK